MSSMLSHPDRIFEQNKKCFLSKCEAAIDKAVGNGRVFLRKTPQCLLKKTIIGVRLFDKVVSYAQFTSNTPQRIPVRYV